MPRYRITEYREVNIVGFSASGTSTIYAKDLSEAQRLATCTNMPKGKWRTAQRNNHSAYIKGSLDKKSGNKSIIVPIPNRPENKNIEDSFTKNIAENNIITNETYKLIQKGLVIRISPYHTGGFILFDAKKQQYLPDHTIMEEHNNPAIFKFL